MASSSQLIDVSHTVEHGIVTYRGLPAPVICDYLSRKASRARYAPGTEFHIGKIEMVGNTGTYVDSPFHRYPAGKDLAALPLTRQRGVPRSIRVLDQASELVGLATRPITPPESKGLSRARRRPELPFSYRAGSKSPDQP